MQLTFFPKNELFSLALSEAWNSLFCGFDASFYIVTSDSSLVLVHTCVVYFDVFLNIANTIVLAVVVLESMPSSFK